MKDSYLEKASHFIKDPRILINVVSIRIKQLRKGYTPLIESSEKLSLEDIVLKEIFEKKIHYQLYNFKNDLIIHSKNDRQK